MAVDTKTRECSLTKSDEKGYGFFLRVEQDIPGHLIRSVEKGSTAEKAGLKDGDRVIKVNGEFVDDKEHPKVVEMIQISGSSVTLTVQDEESYLISKKNKIDQPENKAPSGQATGQASGQASGQAPGQAESPKPRLCYVVKDKGSFGFSLKAQKGTVGFYLEALIAGGAAVKAGVKEGDRIVEVNGKNIENSPYDEIVKLVRESGDSVMFLVVDKETSAYFQQQKKRITADEATTHLLPNPPRIVELDKGADGYGFYLRQEKNRKGHFIVEIEDKSSAQKADLKEYDRIVAVNGDSVESFDHEQVVEAIKKGGNKTTLLIANKATDELYAKAGISPFLYLKSSKAPTPNKTETPKPAETPTAKPAPAPAPTPTQPAVTTSSPDPKHKPKLCRLTKGNTGFGFNLNAIKDVPGQFIKQVTKGGPADVAGIKEDDVLVEVNGVNVEKEAYEDVVLKIKAAGKNVTLLVASQEAYEYFKAQKIQITSSMADPLPETNSAPPATSNQTTPPSKADPKPETNSVPPPSSNQTAKPSKADPKPETNSVPPPSSNQTAQPSKADPKPETNSVPPPSSNQTAQPSKADPKPETNSVPPPSSNQTTQPSKARSAPEPVEKETTPPAEEPPKDDDDTAL